MTNTIKTPLKNSKEKKSTDLMESMLHEVTEQKEEYQKISKLLEDEFKNRKKEQSSNGGGSSGNGNNGGNKGNNSNNGSNSDKGGLSSKEIAEIKAERAKFLKNFFGGASKNQQNIGLALGGVPGALAANVLGGPLKALMQMGTDRLKNKFINRGLDKAAGGSGASAWNNEEKRAAPIKKLNKDNNKNFNKLFKMLGGKQTAEKKDSWFKKLTGFLGKWGGKLGRFIWKPIRWLGSLLWKPIRWLGGLLWKPVRWLGRLIGGGLGKLLNGLLSLVGLKGLGSKLFGKTASKGAAKAATKATAKGATKAATKAATKGAAKAGAKAAAKAGTKAAAKAGAKAGAKGIGKSLLKKIPGVSLIAGGIFAAQRALAGDWAGAAAEMASGVAGCIPGAGTAVSAAIDAGLAVKDVHDATKEANAESSPEDDATPPVAEASSPTDADIPHPEPAKAKTKAKAKSSGKSSWWKTAGKALALGPFGAAYLGYKALKAGTEKDDLETSTAEANNKDANSKSISEQMARVIDMLSMIANNLSPSTQAELDKNYLSMIYSSNPNQFSGFSDNGSLSSMNANLTSPVA